MKTKILQPCYILLFFLGFIAKGDEPFGSEWARADVADITKAGDASVQIMVFFESTVGVSERSFDDADLWVTNAAGFYSRVVFFKSNSLIPLPGPDGEIPPVPLSIGVYQLAPPEGGWTEDHNGEYAVMLAGGEVRKNDGSHFALALAGSFKVAIGGEKRVVPALVGDVSVETFPTPGVPGGNVSELAIGTLTVTFPHPVEVNWGEISLRADGGFCVEVEGCARDELVPQVMTSYSQSVELGMLDPGDYSVELKSDGKVLAAEKFQVAGGSSDLVKGLPSSVEIELVELPTRGIYPVYAANIKLTFGQYVEGVEWSEVSRKRDEFASEVTAWIDPRILIIVPMVIEYQVFLGMTEPGEYRYELSSLEKVIGRTAWIVRGGNGDFQPPNVTVRGATVIEPDEEPLEFSVRFFDESELVMGGIEAQILKAMNQRGELFELVRTRLDFTADFTAGAIATYRMSPPGGSWDAKDRGRYRLLLSNPELVCDLVGNHLTQSFIGYVSVEIDPDDPEPVHAAQLSIRNDEVIGRWTASARLYVPEDLAARDDWTLEWGRVRLVGPSFSLMPRFVRAGSNKEINRIPPSDTTGAGMWVEHNFDLGPVSEGLWVVCLQSNLGHDAKARLFAGVPGDGVEPFDFWRDLSGREMGLTDERSFWEYCVGTDPGDASDDHLGDPKPELVDGEEGGRHLGLRCRIASAAVDARLRFEGSCDMSRWVKLGPDQIEEVERIVKDGGIEEFLVCLVDNLETGEIRYLRVVAERW
tara:strand:- start:980 stop:3250 length:2271 start_codon:yes stop_codon:yes gene_type:complete